MPSIVSSSMKLDARSCIVARTAFTRGGKAGESAGGFAAIKLVIAWMKRTASARFTLVHRTVDAKPLHGHAQGRCGLRAIDVIVLQRTVHENVHSAVAGRAPGW